MICCFLSGACSTSAHSVIALMQLLIVNWYVSEGVCVCCTAKYKQTGSHFRFKSCKSWVMTYAHIKHTPIMQLWHIYRNWNSFDPFTYYPCAVRVLTSATCTYLCFLSTAQWVKVAAEAEKLQIKLVLARIICKLLFIDYNNLIN